MPNYRRAFTPGGTFFFTVVTADRAPLFADSAARKMLHDAIAECRKWRWFDLIAIVLLQNHFHAIWEMPEEGRRLLCTLVHIKSGFTRRWLSQGGQEFAVTESQQTRRRRGIWQTRFWEHRIRDETDLNRHVDYIHFNPVKHGLARCAHEWRWSSFHEWRKRGFYDSNWCCSCDDRKSRWPDFTWATHFEME